MRTPNLFIYFFLFVVNFVIHWNKTAMGLHVFPIPIPPPTSLSTRSPSVFPVHQVRELVSCIQPGLVICFILDTIHVSMLENPQFIADQSELQVAWDCNQDLKWKAVLWNQAFYLCVLCWLWIVCVRIKMNCWTHTSWFQRTGELLIGVKKDTPVWCQGKSISNRKVRTSLQGGNIWEENRRGEHFKGLWFGVL